MTGLEPMTSVLHSQDKVRRQNYYVFLPRYWDSSFSWLCVWMRSRPADRQSLSWL